MTNHPIFSFIDLLRGLILHRVCNGHGGVQLDMVLTGEGPGYLFFSI